MTDEQIKQNAEVYANTIRIGDLGYSPELIAMVSFEDGAHSRDEEIKELEKLLAEMTRLKNSFAGGVDILDRDNKELQEELKSLRKGFYERGDKLKELMLANNQLRNPWISVEERLPDIGQKVITITNKGKLLLVARTTQPPHKEEGGWRWEHYIGKVTHWMPIPEIPLNK